MHILRPGTRILSPHVRAITPRTFDVAADWWDPVGVGLSVAGAWLASYVLNTGDAYSSQLQAGGRIDEGVADKAGMVAALLDIIVPTWIVGRWGLGNRLKRDLTKREGSKNVGNYKQNTIGRA